MTSKERVMTALSHTCPDQVPCDYLATPEVDQKMMECFQVDGMLSNIL